MHVDATRRGTPPVSPWFVLPGEHAIVLLANPTFRICSLFDAVQIKLAVFAHSDAIASGPIEPTLGLNRLVSDHAGVLCCVLERNHFCPAEINDTKSACISATLY